jgi:hypothetical protein
VVLNIAGSLQYWITLQNLKQEYLQHMITWEQLNIEEKVDGTKIIEQNGVRRYLDIEPDYYSASYCTFIQYYRLKYQITIDQKVIYMVNVIMIYSLQCILLFCVFYFVKRQQLENN